MASTAPEARVGRGRRRLERLWRAGTEFLGSPLALMGGAMTWVSEHRLVAALSNAGGFGVLACGAMEPDQLAAEIAATQALTERPFGVNLIIMHPQARAADRGVRRPARHVRRAGRGSAGPRHHRAGQGRWRQAPVFRPEPRRRQAPGARGRRCADHRRHGGRRPHRPGGDQRARPGDPAAPARGAGVRRRRHRPRRGDRRLSAHGRRRLPDGHALRVRQRIDRPSALQGGVHPGERPRRHAVRSDRPRVQGDPGTGAASIRRPATSPPPRST